MAEGLIQEDDYLKLDNQLCFVLYAASRVLTRLYGPFLAQLNLTYPQYLVMLVLWEHQSLSVGDIGARLYLDSGTLTPLLKRLETQGLIARNRLSTDERKVMVSLTEQGREMKKEAASVPRELFCRSGLTLDEFLSVKQSVGKLLDKMIAASDATAECKDQTDSE